MKLFLLLFLITSEIAACGHDTQGHENGTPTTKKVLLAGDSITKNWPTDMKEPNWQSIAVFGFTSAQTLARIAGDITASKAEVVVIASGINDIYGRVPAEIVIDHIDQMITLAVDQGVIPMVATLLPVSEARAVDRPIAKVRELNEAIKALGLERGVRIVDYYPGFLNDQGFIKAELSGDGLHPNHLGYEVMKPILLDALVLN